MTVKEYDPKSTLIKCYWCDATIHKNLAVHKGWFKGKYHICPKCAYIETVQVRTTVPKKLYEQIKAEQVAKGTHTIRHHVYYMLRDHFK